MDTINAALGFLIFCMIAYILYGMLMRYLESRPKKYTFVSTAKDVTTVTLSPYELYACIINPNNQQMIAPCTLETESQAQSICLADPNCTGYTINKTTNTFTLYSLDLINETNGLYTDIKVKGPT